MPEAHSDKLQGFETQDSEVLNQVAPVQNTWYTIFDEVGVLRIKHVSFNIEDTDETLEWRITVDGVVSVPVATACTESTAYHGYVYGEVVLRQFISVLSSTLYSPVARYQGLDGFDILIEVRKTTALGAGNLTGIVLWEKKRHA